MTILINAEIVSDKNKTVNCDLKQLLATRNIRQPIANAVFNGEIFKAFSSRSQNELRMSTITNSIQHCIGDPSLFNKVRQEMKGVKTGKEEIKMLLFTDSMIVYVNNLK